MAVKATHYHSGVHVAESDLLPPQEACPICRAGGPRGAVLRLQSNPEVTLLYCSQCGGYSASRMPSDDALRRYYGRYYENSERIYTFKDPAAFASHILTRAGNLHRTESPAILDFGGGGGDLSQAIARLLLRGTAARVNIDLVDYNSGLSRPDSERVSIQAHETLETVERRGFDLVLASAILEHVPEPWPVITRLFASLGSGAVLYARTPAMVHLFQLLDRFGLHYDFTFPAHVHDMGQDFWERIPQRLPSSCGELRLLSSRPSIVETSFRADPVRTALAYALKSPWYVLGRHYGLVGGWEVFFRKL